VFHNGIFKVDGVAEDTTGGNYACGKNVSVPLPDSWQTADPVAA